MEAKFLRGICIGLAVCTGFDTVKKMKYEWEIEATIGENKYTEYLRGNLMPNEIRLTTSYDMGWNKRSSGHKYDSISGHGFLLGTKNKKRMNHRCLSKCCSICLCAEKAKIKAETHVYWIFQNQNSWPILTIGSKRLVKNILHWLWKTKRSLW